MRVMLFVICWIVTGCTTVTTEKYEALLNGWLNKPEVELVSSWGAPDSVYEVAGKKFISYYSQHNSYFSRTTYHYQPFYTGGWPYYDPINDVSYQVISRVCKTTFTIWQGKVTYWSHQGDGCVAE